MDAARALAVRAQLDPDNPWPGLESYDESSHDFFSGRAAEADELHRRIVDEPVTVLFGKSGLGKTSLLKAGVFPRLREKGYLPIFLRLHCRAGTEPLIEQVRLALFDELGAQEIEHPPSSTGEGLWEYLHRTGLAGVAWRARNDAQHLAAEAQRLAAEQSRSLVALEHAQEQLYSALDQARKSAADQRVAAEAAVFAQNKAEKEARRAGQEKQRADAERNRSQSRELAALAQATMDKDPELAVLLALEGVRRKDTAEARSALLDAAQYT
jgi:pyruvate/2-oxoglutarate dehydrogenase complex dihydrolipoamide acyltransferase (E2) component